MSLSISSSSTAMPPAADRSANLVVSLANLDVLHVSPLAVDWLGLPAERLQGRSLIISVPELGQALTRLIAAGMGVVRTPLNVPLATPTGAHLTTWVHLVGAEAIIDFTLTDEHPRDAQER